MQRELKPLVRRENIVVQKIEKELLVYDLAVNKVFCLNETSKMVYELADGKLTIPQIADRMSVTLKTLVTEDYVKLALHELERDGLLEEAGELQAYLSGIKRRELVKKIGLATMLALPLVSSLVAPSAAMAQSGCAAPGTVSLAICSQLSDVCAVNTELICCSGSVVSVAQPCPISPTFNFSCACA